MTTEEAIKKLEELRAFEQGFDLGTIDHDGDALVAIDMAINALALVGSAPVSTQEPATRPMSPAQKSSSPPSKEPTA